MNEPFAAPTRRALRILSLAYFVQATGAFSVMGCLSVISREWRLTNAQSVSLVSVFGVTLACSAPLLQLAFGRVARRRQVLAGLSLFSGAAWLFAGSPNYPLLLIARVLMGIGAAFIGPVLGALASGLVERERQGSAIAFVLLGLSLANLVGLPLSAWLAHIVGVRELFAIIGLVGVATALLIRCHVPGHGMSERVEWTSAASLLTERGMVCAFLVVFFLTTAEFVTYSFIEPIVREVYHGDTGAVSAALVVLGGAGVIGNLFVTRMTRRHSAEMLLLAGMGLFAAVIALLWLTPARLLWLFVGLAGWAFATDILWPSQQRRIVELAPQLRGMALALSVSFVFGGVGLGSAVAGWIYPTLGYAGVLAGSLLFLLLAAVSLAISHAALRRTEEATDSTDRRNTPSRGAASS